MEDKIIHKCSFIFFCIYLFTLILGIIEFTLNSRFISLPLEFNFLNLDIYIYTSNTLTGSFLIPIFTILLILLTISMVEMCITYEELR